MKLKEALNEDSINRLSTPIKMGNYVIAVDKKNGSVFLWSHDTHANIAPGTELVKLSKQYLDLLYKLSGKKNTI